MLNLGFMLLIFILILDYLVYSATASPAHRLRRWHGHPSSDELKPVAFTGRMSDINSLDESQQKLILQGLHNYMVKHGKHLMEERRPTLPGIAGDSPVVESVVVFATENVEKKATEWDEHSTRMAQNLAEKQLQRVNRVIAPQLDVLKKKGINSERRRR